jgi:hypothetical protein
VPGTQYPNRFVAINGNSRLTQIPLSPAERGTFDRDFRRLAYLQDFQRDLSELLLDDIEFYADIASVAKGSIGTNPVFGGNAASGVEIGMQVLRAITVKNPGIASPTTPTLTWPTTYGAAGWNDVFGSSAAPVDLSQLGLGSGATDTNNRVMLAITALVNLDIPPLLQEYRFHIQNVDYAVEAIAWQQVSNLYYARLASPVVVPVNGKFWMRGDIQPSGKDGTALLGITFATADYLSYET